MSLTSETFVIHAPTYEWRNDVFVLTCTYECGEHSFTETFEYIFPCKSHSVPEDALDTLCALTAIAAAPSYYKAMIAETIKIDFSISQSTRQWAGKLFDNGLREFRFSNDFDYTELPSVDAKIVDDTRAAPNSSLMEKVLVPIGGGKDSATTLSIVARTSVDAVGFSIGTFTSIDATAKVADIDVVRVQRTLDSHLFALNDAGAPNGHVPATALTSVLASIAALHIGADAVVMSNESSADEPTRVVDGVEVNHQWSKSLEAENLLRGCFSSSGITLNYFSLLRTISEYQIFSLFSRAEQFHDVFTSCNNAFKIVESARSSSWCGNCDKCRFVFLGLAAFRGIDYVSELFGHAMFDDETQVQGFVALLGLADTKPFECVGTINETRQLARKVLQEPRAQSSAVGKALSDALAVTDPFDEKIHSHGSDGNIAPTFLVALNAALEESYCEAIRAELSTSTFAVVGIGRDTSAMLRYLSRCGMTGTVQICLPQHDDVTTTELEELYEDNKIHDIGFEYEHVHKTDEITNDVVFVSPGISRYDEDIEFLLGRSTTPLAFWLSLNKKILPHTIFIGVTGTKGKSSTSSMIAHVLDKAIVAGNLGNAVGDISFAELISLSYVVLEVSSFQASYVADSPDVVAVTALFDCHIDWHRTSENYFHDKLNLACHGAHDIVTTSAILDSLRDGNIIQSAAKDLPRQHVMKLDSSSLRKRNEDLSRKVISLVSNLSEEEISSRLATFEDLKYRHEKVGEVNGVTYISDVLSTAPEAVIATLDDTLHEYDGTVFLLFGGAIRDVDHGDFVKHLNERGERVVTITLPETGHAVEKHISFAHHEPELADGVTYAHARAQSGDVVLLAPGAPSFHRYKNYEELAAHFETLVAAL